MVLTLWTVNPDLGWWNFFDAELAAGEGQTLIERYTPGYYGAAWTKPDCFDQCTHGFMFIIDADTTGVNIDTIEAYYERNG